MYLLNMLCFLPHWIVFALHKDKLTLIQERNRWIEIIKNTNEYSIKNFFWLLINLPEYRSILYFRLGYWAKFLKIFASGRESLYIVGTPTKIDYGLVIQHGWSTVIYVSKMGCNCQVWQNVTIGTNKSHSGNLPIIGNNVKISTGAIVLGNIIIGDNVTIGAGAVVVKSVPNNCIVVGNPAYIIQKDGQKVKIKL